ncbi:FAD-binding oxidoreductase [Saccharopolyspora rhizosphaerae]|uniref:D-amino-acid oxidase n=1 Tax=Saccharopolyspora rhizosphaerae TaxID=2492662 RepID=A0A426JPI5_9PSEU|nr:FAD-binding oxidoreductase [Saccharopolyspora rhizosphaerae]
MVVGAGIVGMTCAVELRHRGARVCVVTADEPARTTSWLAAAVWYPVGIGGSERAFAYAQESFDVFADQASQGVPGVRMIDTRMLHRNPLPADPWWSTAVPGFATEGAEHPFTGTWRFSVPLVEVPVYLPWLHAQALDLGVEVRTRSVESLAELADRARTVVNATGLAARTLCGDTTVQPVRGQVIRASNPGLSTSVRDEQHPGGHTYVHPRHRDVIIGGTFEPGTTDTTPDPATAQRLWARATELVPELHRARVLEHHAGLRPHRDDGPRVERDHDLVPGRAVVHNYGHGGAGITLSWGSARDTADLVEHALEAAAV